MIHHEKSWKNPQNVIFHISLWFGMKINISISEYLSGPEFHCSLKSNENRNPGSAYLSSSHLINIKQSWLKDLSFLLPFKESASEGLISPWFCSLKHGLVGGTLI